MSESNWRERTVWGGFAESVARDPAALAVVCADDEATYGQLADLATRAAAGFLRLGVQKGDKIAFWTPNCVAFLGAFLGAARIGAVAVPMNTRFRSDEAGYVLGQSDSVGALVANAGGSTDAMAMLRELCPGIADRNGAELSCQQLPRLKWVVSLDSAEPGFIHWADVVRPLDAVDEAGISSAEAAVTPNHTVVIQYTSGSTAFPKGAMLTHNGITRNAWQFGEAVRQKPGEAQLGPLPFFHVGGLVTAALANLLHGSLLVTMRHFDPDETLRLIEKYRCTLISGVETIYLRLLDHPKLGEHDLSSLDRCVALGTGEFIRRVHDQLGVSSVSTLYGLSEASPNITIVRAGEPLEVSMRTMGRPQPGVTVEIRDPETNESVPPGEHGEICVHGWSIMQGYYNKPKETADAVDSEGWLHTGDLGTLDEQGNLIFLGRVKNVVRVGGENVSPEEVERVLETHPAVKVAQIVAAPDPRLVEVCVAYVERIPGESATDQELIEFCRARLAGFKVPRRVRFVTEWPMTGSGKIQRRALRDQEFAQTQTAPV